MQLAIGLLTAATMIALLGWSTWDSWRAAVRDSERATAQITTSLALQADEMIDRGASLVVGLRQHLDADRSLLEPGNPRLADLITKLLSAAPPWIGISVADAEGRLVGASTHADLKGRVLSIALQPSFRMFDDPAATGDAVRISPTFVLQTRPLRAFVVGADLRDASGALIAVALVSVPSAEVLKSLDPVRRNVVNNLALVHRDGYFLAEAPIGVEPLSMRSNARWVAALADRAATRTMRSPFSQADAIVSHERLARFPVVAVAARDRADLAATWIAEHRPELTAKGLAALAIIAVNLWLVQAVRGRLRAEAELRVSSEGRFKEFAAIATDWFWETDAEHRFTFVSDGAGAEGRPPEAYLGKTRRERAHLLHGSVSERVQELEARMDRREPIRGFVIDSVRPNGQRAWWEVSGQPLIDDAGRFLGYRGVARDVTELREAQERSIESEARLADSIDCMPIGYVLWDSRDRLVTWNRRYLEIWPKAAEVLRPGITYSAFIEKAIRASWPELSADELRDRVADRVARHAACSTAWVREFPDGRFVEFSEVRTSGGGIVSLYVDVTAHRRAVRDLNATEARFRDGIESMAQGFMLWGADEALVTWNSRAETLLPHAKGLFVQGIARSRFLTEAARQLFADMPDAEREEMARRRIETQGRGESFEIRTGGRIIVATSHRTSEDGIVVTYNDVTDLHAAEAALRESEARFRDGIDSMDQGFMLWSADARLLAWNRRAVALLAHAEPCFVKGIARDEFLEMATRRCYPHFDEAQVREWIARRHVARVQGTQVEIHTPTGLIIVATTQPTSTGGIVVTYNDVTAQRAVEAALRESEARFRDGIESMADGFTLWDADDRLIAWNSRFARIAPIEAEVLHQGIAFSACMDHLEAAFSERRPAWDWRGYIAQRRDRRAALGRPIEVTNILGTTIEIIEQPTSDGGVVSIYRDVTEARSAARRLAESETRFHDFADSASDWFWETDAEHRFTFVSAGLRKLGKEPDALIGRTREQHARERGREPSPELAELRAMLDRREVIRGFCFTSSENSAGVRHAIEIHGKPVFDADGTFVGYRGVGRDVTQRNQQQAELARALAAEREMNAQQRRFVSIASHEFRTPLAVIDGATQRLLARITSDDPEIGKRLDRIRGAVSRMTELIDRTLSSARLDEGRIAMQTRMVDLGALLREVSERQRQISASFDIEVQSVAEDLQIEGDAKLLEQVFSNLLSNAVKYSGRARRVEIQVHATAAAVDVAVRDHGLGIHADEIPQLFTRFFRARSSMGIPGTGIGLHLVRELVQMHGGEVFVDSAIGAGTTFTVSLPRRQHHVAAVDAAQ